MMPSFNAAAPPVEKFTPAIAGQRSTYKDQNNDRDSFRNLLRKSREENREDSTTGQPAAKTAASDVDASKKSDDKEIRFRKKDKSEKADGSNATAVAEQTAAPVRPKPALHALLSLISAAQPVQNNSEATANPEIEMKNELAADVQPPADGAKTDLKRGVSILPPGKEKATGGQGFAVPLSFDPILITNTSWAQNANTTPAASGNSSGAIAGAASPAVATSSDSLVLATQQNPESSAPALSSRTLAFAMRLSSLTPQSLNATKTPDENPPSLKALLENNGVSLIETSAANGEKDHTGDGSSSSSNMFGSAYADLSAGARTSSEKASFSEATQDLKGIRAEEPVATANNADPLRNILLQLKSDDNRRVDVRLIDRGGELHVSVKSADPALAQQLQEHMPELSSRLSDQQFNHDVWMPKLSEVSKSESANNGNSFHENGGQSGQPNSSESGRQQNGSGQSRPDWVDLLENQLG